MKPSLVRRLTIVMLSLAIHATAQTLPSLKQWKEGQPAIRNDKSVVACYDFEEGDGTTLKNKAAAGSALDGVIQGAEWSQGRWPGKKALQFNGKTSLVEIPAHDLLCPLDRKKGGTGEMTIEVWMKADSYQNAGIVDKSSGGNATDAPYALWMMIGRLTAYLGKQTGNRVATGVDEDVAEKGQWMHVAITADRNRLALYKDGALVGSEERKGLDSADNDGPLLLGGLGKGSLAFNGLMDELVIYNRALSAADIEKRASSRPPDPRFTGPPSLGLTAPRGGSSLSAESWHRVMWKSRPPSPRSTVKIELSTDDGKTWKELSASAPNTGSFLWQVPSTPAAACRIRISDPQHKLSAQSDRPFAIGPTQQVNGYAWEKVTLEAPFAPRDGLGVLGFQGRMWVIGGWNPNDKTNFPRICNNEVWSSADGADWKLEKPNSFLDEKFDPERDWEGRHTAGYVVYKDRMWIVGGDCNQHHYMFDVWNSADGKAWTHVNKDKPVPWGPRALHHTLVFKDRIWVMGGQTMPAFVEGEEAFYRDIWTTSDGVSWQQIRPKEPCWSPRGIIGGNAVFKDRIWILGGGIYETPQSPKRRYYNDVWSSPDGLSWECHSEAAPWEPRQYHDVATFDGRIWVLEGFGPEKKPANRNDVWYSSDGLSWYELPNTPWGARHAAGLVVHDNALWIIAGNNMSSDVWKLTRAK